VPTHLGAPVIARRIARGVYWLLCAFVVIAGVSSVVPQVFWPARRVSSRTEPCAETLRSLERDLSSFASDRVASPATGNDRQLRRWLDGWDQRYASAEPQCTGTEERAYRVLGRLRYSTEGLLRRHAREAGPLAREVASVLGEPVVAPPSTPAHAPESNDD